MKLSYLTWQEKSAWKKSRLFYVGGILRNTYFYSCGHYGGCVQIGRVENFGDFGPCMYRLGSYTWADFKVRGGQKKNLY